MRSIKPPSSAMRRSITWARVVTGFFTDEQNVKTDCCIKQFPYQKGDNHHVYQIELGKEKDDKNLTWFCDAVVSLPDQRVIQITTPYSQTPAQIIYLILLKISPNTFFALDENHSPILGEDSRFQSIAAIAFNKTEMILHPIFDTSTVSRPVRVATTALENAATASEIVASGFFTCEIEQKSNFYEIIRTRTLGIFGIMNSSKSLLINYEVRKRIDSADGKTEWGCYCEVCIDSEKNHIVSIQFPAISDDGSRFIISITEMDVAGLTSAQPDSKQHNLSKIVVSKSIAKNVRQLLEHFSLLQPELPVVVPAKVKPTQKKLTAEAEALLAEEKEKKAAALKKEKVAEQAKKEKVATEKLIAQSHELIKKGREALKQLQDFIVKMNGCAPQSYAAVKKFFNEASKILRQWPLSRIDNLENAISSKKIKNNLAALRADFIAVEASLNDIWTARCHAREAENIKACLAAFPSAEEIEKKLYQWRGAQDTNFNYTTLRWKAYDDGSVAGMHSLFAVSRATRREFKDEPSGVHGDPDGRKLWRT